MTNNCSIVPIIIFIIVIVFLIKAFSYPGGNPQNLDMR